MHENTQEQTKYILGVSKSLTLFCNDSTHIAGMIAYGLYKQSQNSWAIKNIPSDEEVKKFSQNITPELKAAFEMKALSLLSEFVAEAKDSWELEERESLRKEIYSEIADRINKNTTDKFNILNKNTSFINNTLSNLAATIAAGALALLILALVATPNFIPEILKSLLKFFTGS